MLMLSVPCLSRSSLHCNNGCLPVFSSQLLSLPQLNQFSFTAPMTGSLSSRGCSSFFPLLPPPPPPPIPSKKRFHSLFYRQLQVQIKMLLQCSENPKCDPAAPLEVQMFPIKYFLHLSMKNQFAGEFNNTMYLEAKFVSCCWLLSSDAAQGKVACGKEQKTGEIPTLITSMGLDAMAPAKPARKLALQKTARKQWQCVRGEN